MSGRGTEVPPDRAPSSDAVFENIEGQDVDPLDDHTQQTTRKQSGTPRYEWTERLECDHAGTYQDKRDPNLPPEKRRTHRRKQASIKVDCKAHIWMRKQVSSEEVHVQYHWRHQNHVYGSLEDFRDSRNSFASRQWINEKVHNGLDWKAVRGLLRLTSESLDAVSSLTYNITMICSPVPF